jgi:hypothetical protein
MQEETQILGAVHHACLSRWLKIGHRDDGISIKPMDAAPTSTGVDLDAKNRELRRRVPRRASSRRRICRAVISSSSTTALAGLPRFACDAPGDVARTRGPRSPHAIAVRPPQ